MRGAQWSIFFPLAVLLVAAGGCVNQVYPPTGAADPVTVYVADHGKHSSLLLPDGEVVPGEDGYVQYAYGDWIAFVENDNSPGSYLRAAFFSHRSALGRRLHETQDHESLRRRIHAVRLEPVIVERAAADALRSELESYWAAGAPPVDNRLVRLSFVTYAGPNQRYALWNHCNHTTARWLRRLGCRVWRPAMTSDFRVAAVKQ